MGIVGDVVLPLVLAFIMFALGLGLTVDDFVRVVKRPRDFAIGAVSQIILLPAVAFILISIWDLPNELALGVMIIAAAPGGVTSNILTAFARGDVALSISLTAVISLLSVVTIPLIVAFSYAHIMKENAVGHVSVASTAISVFAIVAVPVIAGLITRHLSPKLAVRLEPSMRSVSAVLFVLVLLGAIYQERGNVVAYFTQAGSVTLVLNVLMMLLAYLVASLLASGTKQKIAISIECGLQNGTLAIAVSTLLFGGGLTVIPAATYSLIMFVTALLYIAVLRLGAGSGASQ